MLKQALTENFLLNTSKAWLIRGLFCESAYNKTPPDTTSSEFSQMEQTDFKTVDLTTTVTGQIGLTAPFLNFQTRTKAAKTLNPKKQLGGMSSCKPHVLKMETNSNVGRTQPGRSSTKEYFISRPCVITNAANHMRPTSIRSDSLELPTETLRKQQSTVSEQEYTKESSVSEWLLQCNNASLHSKDEEAVINESTDMDHTHLRLETTETLSTTYLHADNKSHTRFTQQFVTWPSSSCSVNSKHNERLFLDPAPIKITESHNFVRSTTSVSKLPREELNKFPTNDDIISQGRRSTKMTQYSQYAESVDRPSGSKVEKTCNQETDWTSISSSEWGDDICEFDRLQSRRVQQMFEDIDHMLFESQEPLRLRSTVPPTSAQSRKSCKNRNTEYSVIHLERECQDWLHRFPHLRVVGTQIIPSENSEFIFRKSTNEAVQSRKCSPTTSNWDTQSPQTLKYPPSQAKYGILQNVRRKSNLLVNKNECLMIEKTNQQLPCRDHDSKFTNDPVKTNFDPESNDIHYHLPNTKNLTFSNEENDEKYEEIIAADDQESRDNEINRSESNFQEKSTGPGHHCDFETDRFSTDPELVRPARTDPSTETLLLHIRKQLCYDISNWLKLTSTKSQNADTTHKHQTVVSELNKSTIDCENVNLVHTDQPHWQYQQRTSPDPTCESWEVNSQFRPFKQFTGGGRLQPFSEKTRAIQKTRATQLCTISQSTTSGNPVGLSDLLQISTKALQQRERPILEHLDIQKTNQPSCLAHGVDEDTPISGGNQWNPSVQRLSPQPLMYTTTRPFSCLNMKLVPHSSRKSGIVTCSTQPESSYASCGSGVIGIPAHLYHAGRLAPLEIVPTHSTMSTGSVSEDFQTYNSAIYLNAQTSMEPTVNCLRNRLTQCTVSQTTCPNVTAITTFLLSPGTYTHTQASVFCPDVKTTNVPVAISTDTIAGRSCTLPPLYSTGTILPIVTNTSSQAIGLSGSSVPTTRSLHSLNLRTGSVVQHSHVQNSVSTSHTSTAQNPPEIRGANFNLVTQQINNSGVPIIPNSNRPVRWISSRPGPEQYRSVSMYRGVVTQMLRSVCLLCLSFKPLYLSAIFKSRLVDEDTRL
ncbi:hypothetical protein EG68_06177 [Paragonimus skrjabini miyazakii]|uniref:DUF3719 domain-containing protein n=1 Tax=Paragonimus skrjabini miyazakii TaxID=59628 RepID=A0A8S9YMW6_9TREM|nr:hypothetical protein EG68_06177 [Paragonimus skrjabini miyazakii]